MTASSETNNFAFTDKALASAPDLLGARKIHPRLLKQAFSLRKGVSLPTFIAIVKLFFLLSCVFLLVLLITYSIFGTNIIQLYSQLADKQGSMFGLASGFVLNIFTCALLMLMYVFGVGFVWRYHSGQGKKFFATLPSSWNAFWQLLWPSVFYTTIFTAIILVINYFIIKIIFFSLDHQLIENSNNSNFPPFVSKLLQAIIFIEAICVLSLTLFVFYLLFQRYKKAKMGIQILPMLQEFVVEFKKFFSQILRFLCVLSLFYLIAVFPLVSGMAIIKISPENISKICMAVLAVGYLVFSPWIITTGFNLNLLMFQSIENFRFKKKSSNSSGSNSKIKGSFSSGFKPSAMKIARNTGKKSRKNKK